MHRLHRDGLKGRFLQPNRNTIASCLPALVRLDTWLGAESLLASDATGSVCVLVMRAKGCEGNGSLPKSARSVVK